ncbi:AmmeMemoRadiSam system radical SAM enzyme [Sedimenticola sp.]|uniref:AmmeMemoRadiSam system radical SAM enzyme n=1 Tax=Sedimenticola sp. TaxID=1940285 RepID=UPI003D0AF246
MNHPIPMDDYQLVETCLQEQLPGGTVRCGLCSWRCKVGHGQRGFCQAHVNRNGTLYNLSYGIISSIDVNPVEAKPVRHFRPGTRVLSVGSYGCSFRCGGCHNLEISWGVTALDELARGASTEAFITPHELVQAALREGVQGIAFTYSEPAVWLEYILDVAPLAHRAGLYTVYVSNSFITPEALTRVAPHIDVLCSDIKSLRDEFYHEICPTAQVEQVLSAIELAHELGIHVETRTNVIPGKNDDPDELYRIACWVRDHLGEESPWHITRFFPAYKLSHIPETPTETLWQAQAAAQRAGLKNSYIYGDTGCDCAKENKPLQDYFPEKSLQLHAVKKCSASCCGEEGVLLKKYE